MSIIDFLNNIRLLVNCKEKKIIDPTTSCTKKLKTHNSEINLAINNNVPDLIWVIINEYPNMVLLHTHADREYNGVYYRTDIGSHTPTFAKVKKLSDEKTEAIHKEF